MTEKPAQVQMSILRRHWWVWALLVLFVLVGILYWLSHLSAADLEMYPTTMLRQNATNWHLWG
jgi:hypothetical protein